MTLWKPDCGEGGYGRDISVVPRPTLRSVSQYLSELAQEVLFASMWAPNSNHARELVYGARLVFTQPALCPQLAVPSRAGRRALASLEAHPPSQPYFLYLPWQAVRPRTPPTLAQLPIHPPPHVAPRHAHDTSMVSSTSRVLWGIRMERNQTSGSGLRCLSVCRG